MSDYLANPRLILGVALYGLAFLVWLVTLRSYAVTTVYPLFIGVGYVTVIAASFALLHEPLSPWKLTGITLVGVGVVLVVAS